ncbi:MAG: ABC transporter permease, partial [Jiangellaceae bacterium]
SWFSPIAWSQQTRAYVDGRWWPLLISVGFTAAVAAVGYALSTRRDVGAGLVAARGGRASAAPWLRSPATLAFRLQRASLIGWGSALAALGLIYGALTEPVLEAYEDMPGEMVAVLGGDAGNLFDGYLSVMALFDALLVGVFAILGVQAFRAEETKGRAEPVLATATGRSAWFGSHLGVLVLGAAGLLLLVGLALGGSAAISVGDTGVLWDLVAAHLVYLPAVLSLLGIAAVLAGILPRAVGATWAVLGFAMIVGFFGPIMDLPQWVHNLSPFEHVSRVPLEDAAWTPLLVLTVLGAVLAAMGIRLLRQRDLETK